MVLQHNLSAMNVSRQYGIVIGEQAKISERLASGYQLNRAADNAAGLTISEKMRSMIRGLEQAALNAQDGISLLQTAEGALGESQSIIHRMRELAVQAANDTNVTADRDTIQKEMDELIKELDGLLMILSLTHSNC